MKPLLVNLSGLPFSGKSTLARALSESLGMQIVNYDDDIYANHKHEVPVGTSAAKEFEFVQSIARQYLAKKLKSGQSLIYDDLGLQKEDRKHIADLAESCGASYVLVFLDTPTEIIEERRKANARTNGREHIDDAKLRLDISLLEKPDPNEDPIIVLPGTPVEQVVSSIKSHK